MLVFDIETEPLPTDQLESVMPEFNESTVAVGNLKDPDKIATKLAEARQKWIDKAALSAATGRVLAIGYLSPDKAKLAIDHGISEVDLLQRFWSQATKIRDTGRKLIGINIHDFDLPFMVRRSWINQVDVPSWVRDGRYFAGQFLDLRDEWLLGQREGSCESSMDHIAKALGFEGKNGEGKDFAKLYHGTAQERGQALAYLENDLQQIAKISKRIGLL